MIAPNNISNIIQSPSDSQPIDIGTWLLAVYLFLAPLDFFQIVPGMSPQRLLIFLPILGAVLQLKWMRLHFNSLFVLPCLFVLFTMGTMFYTVSVESTQRTTITAVLNIAIILLFSTLQYNAKEIKLLKSSVLYSSWLAILLMIIYADRDLMGGRLTVRIGEDIQDPNYLIGFFIYAIAFYTDRVVRKNGLINYLVIILIIGLSFLTGSRSGLFGLLTAFFVYLLLYAREKKPSPATVLKGISLVLLLLMFLAIVIGFMPVEVRERFDFTLATVTDEGSGRLKIWNSIFESFYSASRFSQFFGMGAGTSTYFTYNNKVAHNIWLDSIIDVGIVGTLILLFFYSAFMIRTVKLNEHVIAACFAGYMVMAFFLSLVRYRPIWNILLLIVIISNNLNIVKSNNESGDKKYE